MYLIKRLAIVFCDVMMIKNPTYVYEIHVCSPLTADPDKISIFHVLLTH